MKKILLGLIITYAANICGQTVSGTLSERVYLQTDKQFYLAGELVYLKAFTVTSEIKPLSFSKIVYVELLDETKSLGQVKIALSYGLGESWMELPIDLPTGHYRLIAYTRFMRNEGESVFFEKIIGVVNTFRANQIRKAPMEPSQRTSETYVHQTCTVQTDKKLYATREKGSLKLDGLPEDIHTLSVSIAGQAPVEVDGTNEIRLWEKQILEQNTRNLETVTQNLKFLPEYEGHIITGKIVPLQVSSNTESEVLTPLLSFPGEKFYIYEGQKDDANNVLFYTTDITGVKEIATIAYSLTDNKFRIDLQSPFIEQYAHKPLAALRVDSTHFTYLLKRAVSLQALYAYVKDSLALDRLSDIRFYREASKTYILDEWTRFIVMGELVIEFISELQFRRNNRQKRELMMSVFRHDFVDWVRPLVVLDGIPIFDHEIIYQYNPLLVERINIYSDEYIYEGMRFDGIVEFLTYERNCPSLPIDPSMQIVSYEGTQVPRRLYTPDYSNEKDKNSRLPDYRHTLLWEPMLQTNGLSTIEIPFYTSDFTGEFLVTVEGLTKSGEIIHATAYFETR